MNARNLTSVLLCIVACKSDPASQAVVDSQEGPAKPARAMPLDKTKATLEIETPASTGLSFDIRPKGDVPVDPDKPAAPAIDMDVRSETEGVPAAKAELTPLSKEEQATLLSRMEDITKGDDEKKFALRKGSRPAPRPGTTVKASFPPPARPAPPPRKLEPLSVLRMSPEGEVANVPKISVTFSQPMVPLSAVSDVEAQKIPVTLKPQPPGKWNWLGTRTLVFEPKAKFPMATHYKVTAKAGATSELKTQLAKAEVIQFSTPPPKLTSYWPTGNRAPTTRDIALMFDQKVDPAEVAKRTTIRVGGKVYKARVLKANEAKDENTPDWTTNGQGLVLRLNSPLPKDTRVTVDIAKGLPSAEGPRTSPAKQNASFKTYPPLRFKKIQCGWNNNCPPNHAWSIQFNQQLDQEKFSKDWVKVTPALEKIDVVFSYNGMQVTGRSKGRTKYTVELSPEITDAFGQKLGKTLKESVQVGPANPMARIEGGNYAVLDPHGPRTLSLFTINIADVDVRIRSVDAEDWTKYVQISRSYQWQDSLTDLTVGKKVYSKKLTIKKSNDELIETKIDLSSALSKGKGRLIVDLRPTRDPQRRVPRRIIQWVESTQLSSTVFTDHERMLVWVTRLKDGAPVAGASVQLQPNGPQAVTGPDGTAEIELPEQKNWRSPNAGILVGKDGDTSFLPERQWNSGGSSWTRRELAGSARWFVFDDRGLYKPKETVNIKGWVRGFDRGPQGDLHADSPVTKINWEARGPRGNELGKGVLKPNKQGGFDLKIKLPDDVNLGSAYVSFSPVAKEGKRANSHSHSFKIQEFRRPEFEVLANADPSPWVVGQSKEISVEAKYFTGGALPGADVSWTVYSSPGSFTPPGWSGFTFGAWTPWWRYDHYGYHGKRGRGGSRQNIHSVAGKTDATGQHVLSVDLKGVTPARTMNLTAEASVVDVNRQRWSATVTRVVHPADRLIGLNTNRYFVARNEDFEIRHVVVDINGRAVAGVPVNIEAFLNQNRRSADKDKEVKPAATCSVDSQSSPQTCKMAFEDPGTYQIIAKIKDASGRLHQTERSLWVAGAEAPPTRRLAEEKVTLIPSAKEFKVGTTAEILVVAPFAKGQGLLTVRREGFVSHETFELKNGSYVLKIPIKEEHIPTLHVEVDLAGSASRGDEAPPRPAFASGRMQLKIPARERTLQITASPADAEVEPGAKLNLAVNVKDGSGKPVAVADVAVAIVDEAVLSLAGPRSLDPIAAFYPGLPAGVNEWHARQFVVLGDPEALAEAAANEPSEEAEADMMGGEKLFKREAKKPSARRSRAKAAPAPMSSALADSPKDMGGRQQNTPIVVRKDFSALAHFSPSVTTDAQGNASVEVALPDSLTRYRVFVFAAAGKEFGLQETNITARQQLMVRPSAPRFLNFGDKFELPIVVENQTDAPLDVQVALRASNLNLSGGGYRLSVPAKDRIEVRFNAAAKLPGTVRFQVAATAGDAADAAEVSLPVWTPATTEAFATYGSLENGTTAHTVLAPSDVEPSFGGLKIATASTQLQSLTDAFIYLLDYPYGCAAQVSSRVLSVAALVDVLTAFEAEGMPREAEMKRAMGADLNKLARLQNDDGGWGFWNRHHRSWPFVSVHVMHALTRAKDKDFEIDKGAHQRGMAYLKTIKGRFPSDYPESAKRAIESYALYVRALNGDHDGSAAKRIIAAEGGVKKANLEVLGWLYPVLLEGKGTQSELQQLRKHLKNRVTETAGTAHFVTSYGQGTHLILHSSRRVDGILLEGLLRDQPNSDLSEKLVRGLLAHKKKGRWANTQESVWVLLGLDRYFRVKEKITPSFVARAWLGDRFAGEHGFRGRTTETHEINIPMAEVLKEKKSTLTLQNEGKGRMYYRLGLNYAPKSLNLESLDRGFEVTRTYAALDNKDDVRQDEDGTWIVKAGARVQVTLGMVATGRRYHVALVDKLPAGFEPVNPALAAQERPAPTSGGRGGRYGWWWGPWYEHQNLRDERVEAFSSLLYGGSYTYSYTARATTPGDFVAPPAKAEEMYMPETFGRSATARVRVVE